jgi:hypothetical protein
MVLQELQAGDHVTGEFRGKLSSNCRLITGYFSKPDGSRLQLFELHQTE